MKLQIRLLLLLTLLAAVGGAFISAQCGLYVLGSCIAINLIIFHFIRKQHVAIALLTTKIDCLLHGEEQVDFTAFQEGEIAILSNEIDKMAIRLREQATALEKDKRYLQDALADISHQLKTPLTTLRMLTARLRAEALPAEERISLVVKAESILARVEWLVQALLKISRLESGTVAMAQKNVAVAEIIAKAVETFEIPMELRQQTLTVQIPHDAHFIGDFGWTCEALENIVKNCMEHTPAGGSIHIIADENPLYTEIVIADSGSGIPTEDMPHIFERFYQGQNTSGHFGIGLALSQMIIHRQNGTIRAENNRGSGAKFTIRFYPHAL